MRLLIVISIEELGLILSQNDWPLLIATYCDYRIAPGGIVGFNERLGDLVARPGHKPNSQWASSQIVRKHRNNLRKCENLLQKHRSIDLSDVQGRTINDAFQDFLHWEIT